MVQGLKIVLALVAPLLLCAPLAIVLTALSSPFWEWFESATSVQAYGHSGPLEWCYLTTFALLLTGSYALIYFAVRRPSGAR